MILIYEFTDLEMVNIKERTKNKQRGTKEYYTNCCERKKASISFDRH